jgi:hypothetical protein
MFIRQELQLSLAPFDRPFCPECAAPMFHVEMEPDAPGAEFPTYECRNCKFTQRSAMRC